ncbi:MAG: hypothetical protein LBP36_03650 [Oscillospiraceae bacterium]|jgi:predicted  nucleic acid-binding Zn-ribbon protein|nr:hypothetical protein [Oscillospiraceae bacterium]
MEISEKAAYLKGLVEGLGLDENSDESKIFHALTKCVQSAAEAIENLQENFDVLDERIENIEKALDDLEDEFYEEEKGRCHCEKELDEDESDEED